MIFFILNQIILNGLDTRNHTNGISNSDRTRSLACSVHIESTKLVRAAALSRTSLRQAAMELAGRPDAKQPNYLTWEEEMDICIQETERTAA